MTFSQCQGLRGSTGGLWAKRLSLEKTLEIVHGCTWGKGSKVKLSGRLSLEEKLWVMDKCMTQPANCILLHRERKQLEKSGCGESSILSKHETLVVPWTSGMQHDESSTFWSVGAPGAWSTFEKGMRRYDYDEAVSNKWEVKNIANSEHFWRVS